MTEKKDYIAAADGWIAGRPVKAGDMVRLTEREARYEPVQPAAVDGTTVQAEPVRRGKTRPETDA